MRRLQKPASRRREAEPGSFVTCEVTEAHPYDLVARVVRPGGPGGMPPE